MRKIGVNWYEVSELSKRTLNNSEEFEAARKKYQETLLSINENWEGPLAEKFIVDSYNFLEQLKNQSNYLSDMGNVFKKSSRKYSGVVEEHEERIKRMNQLYLDEQYKINNDGRNVL